MLLLGQVLLEFLAELLELPLARGELGLAGLRIDGDEVDPVPGVRVQYGFDGRVARAVDRTGRQALVLVGVVRRRALELGVAGDDAERVQAVQHGAVELERDALLHPVVDHPGDLRVVGETAAFGLDQAGHGDDLAGGEPDVLAPVTRFTVFASWLNRWTMAFRTPVAVSCGTTEYVAGNR